MLLLFIKPQKVKRSLSSYKRVAGGTSTEEETGKGYDGKTGEKRAKRSLSGYKRVAAVVEEPPTHTATNTVGEGNEYIISAISFSNRATLVIQMTQSGI